MTPTTALVRRPRVRGPLIVFALIVGMLLGIATAAQAHTDLASSDPAAGSTVTGPPPAVGLTFSGQVLLREVTVTGPTGAAATGGATVNGAVVTQPVALTDAGTYTVDYAVTSSDGHPVEGTLTFAYAPPPPPSPTSEAPTSTTAPSSTTAVPAAPSGAVADSPAQSSAGLPDWAPAAGVAVVVALAAVLLLAVRRRARR